MINFDQIETNARKRDIPVMTKSTMKFMKKQLNKFQPKNCLEIWSAIWYSSLFIAQEIQNWWWKIIGFEISYPTYKEALSNLFEAKQNNLTIYNCDFSKIQTDSLVSNWLDFVFIDARKKDYLEYFLSIQKHLWPECIIIFDDVIKFKDKMADLYEFLEKNQLNHKILQLDKDDWVLYLEVKN